MRNRQKIADKLKIELSENSSTIFSTTEIVEYNKKQKFAVFHTGNDKLYDTAMELRKIRYPKKFNSWDNEENTPGDGFFPAKYNKKYWLKYNDYEIKLLCFSIFTIRRGKTVKRCYQPLWINTGWLTRNELKLPTAELNEKISDEFEQNFSTTRSL